MGTMVGRRKGGRVFWLMLALAGLFGIFTAQSTNTLKFNHLPGRICARAGGTASSLAQRERIENVAAVSESVNVAATMPAGMPFLRLPEFQPAPYRAAEEQLLPASPVLWPPPLLFRPPPFSSVA